MRYYLFNVSITFDYFSLQELRTQRILSALNRKDLVIRVLEGSAFRNDKKVVSRACQVKFHLQLADGSLRSPKLATRMVERDWSSGEYNWNELLRLPIQSFKQDLHVRVFVQSKYVNKVFLSGFKLNLEDGMNLAIGDFFAAPKTGESKKKTVCFASLSADEDDDDDDDDNPLSPCIKVGSESSAKGSECPDPSVHLPQQTSVGVVIGLTREVITTIELTMPDETGNADVLPSWEGGSSIVQHPRGRLTLGMSIEQIYITVDCMPCSREDNMLINDNQCETQPHTCS